MQQVNDIRIILNPMKQYYQDFDSVEQDIYRLLSKYPKFKLTNSISKLSERNYITALGYLPIIYNNKPFGTPIIIHFTYDYPLSPPEIMCNVMEGMEIVKNHPEVEPNGVITKINQKWNPSSDLIQILESLSQAFGRMPPVRKSLTKSVTQTQSIFPNSNGSFMTGSVSNYSLNQSKQSNHYQINPINQPQQVQSSYPYSTQPLNPTQMNNYPMYPSFQQNPYQQYQNMTSSSYLNNPYPQSNQSHYQQNPQINQNKSFYPSYNQINEEEYVHNTQNNQLQEINTNEMIKQKEQKQSRETKSQIEIDLEKEIQTDKYLKGYSIENEVHIKNLRNMLQQGTITVDAFQQLKETYLKSEEHQTLKNQYKEKMKEEEKIQIEIERKKKEEEERQKQIQMEKERQEQFEKQKLSLQNEIQMTQQFIEETKHWYKTTCDNGVILSWENGNEIIIREWEEFYDFWTGPHKYDPKSANMYYPKRRGTYSWD